MQIVGYEAGTTTDFDDGDPALLVAEGDGERRVRRVGLDPGTELAYSLEERRCAGVLDGDDHRPCGRPRAPYCEDHAHTWVCARCTGTCLKPEMDCHQDHAVYLAAFAPDAFKVGVTKLWRLRRRLVEQGADRGAHVHTVTNGRIAREIEAETATEIPDRVRVPTKVEGLGTGLDGDAWEALLAEFDVQERIDPAYDLPLDRRPVADTLASGTVRGVKGRVLLLERGGTTYAVDMRELVGHEVTDGDPGRDLQSSLGAFG
ncbi:DUF2797 domain-containing protein [Halobacteriales archaeon QS_8_69_26]|nr:MAG: DUF2797 domain-containing protein [Halobacteriales archaeon QS_8_69_26]